MPLMPVSRIDALSARSVVARKSVKDRDLRHCALKILDSGPWRFLDLPRCPTGVWVAAKARTRKRRRFVSFPSQSRPKD